MKREREKEREREGEREREREREKGHWAHVNAKFSNLHAKSMFIITQQSTWMIQVNREIPRPLEINQESIQKYTWLICIHPRKTWKRFLAGKRSEIIEVEASLHIIEEILCDFFKFSKYSSTSYLSFFGQICHVWEKMHANQIKYRVFQKYVYAYWRNEYEWETSRSELEKLIQFVCS